MSPLTSDLLAASEKERIGFSRSPVQLTGTGAVDTTRPSKRRLQTDSKSGDEQHIDVGNTQITLETAAAHQALLANVLSPTQSLKL